MTVTTLTRNINGGVDTHLDVHVAAALDDRGALLGVESFATTADGYKKLLGWFADFGPVELVGVEGTAPMVPGSPAISKPSASASSRSIAPTASAGDAKASPILKTPSRPRVLLS